MLNAYNGKTDIAFCFSSEEEIDYDRRNMNEQKRMIRENFEDGGWRTRELLDEMSRCEDFYFDKLCQVRMQSWTKGRVALSRRCRLLPVTGRRDGWLRGNSWRCSPGRCAWETPGRSQSDVPGV